MSNQLPTEDQLVGIWYRLGAAPHTNQRIGGDPSRLSFEMWQHRLRWSASDGVNTTSGLVVLESKGGFRTSQNAQTLAGRVPRPSIDERLTISIVTSATRVELNQGELTFYDNRGPLGVFYRHASAKRLSAESL